jgi:hypothetical protein
MYWPVPNITQNYCALQSPPVFVTSSSNGAIISHVLCTYESPFVPTIPAVSHQIDSIYIDTLRSQSNCSLRACLNFVATLVAIILAVYTIMHRAVLVSRRC